MRAIRRFTVRPVLPESLAALGDLATNLRWSWHPETQDLFAALDAEAWESSGHDPVRTLGAVDPGRLEGLAEDAEFLRSIEAASADLDAYLTQPRWFQRWAASRDDVPRTIAYFSSEYGISSVMAQYSGGLGILAGDHLKTASDLGVPLTGVGLLYQSGYFEQSLSREGWQHESYPMLDPHELPIRPLREHDGSLATIALDLPDDQRLHARIWVAQVGRVPLLLLDSNVEHNPRDLQSVTNRLYGGTQEHRLLQELLLGVGGIRALRTWCRITGAPAPDVFHANEGHAGFQGIERIRELTVDPDGPQLDFDTALEMTRAATVFTTHTPVPAGIDRFDRNLVTQYFSSSSPTPGVPVERILELGLEQFEGGDPDVFNMAVLGFRLAQRANGVSLLHGEVSREMFQALWSAFDSDEVPISSITNGVHAPTWVGRDVLDLAQRHGFDPATAGPEDWSVIDRIPAEEIWATRRDQRLRLVQDVRRRLRAAWVERGASQSELGWVDDVLDPDVLTVGFARRVPAYKRLTLMLRSPERLKALLLDPERPMQLIVAGKAHPLDDLGKGLIQELVRFADDPAVRHRIVFLPNYDIGMALPLYPGCDVWLNNPLRPYEACGTSGMKAALNGGLNLSVLDGWWDEWFDGDNGWAIPSAHRVDDPDHRDDLEAAALYDLIETEVAPRFYDRGPDGTGVPGRWIEMVRHTLTSLGPKVLASRMLRQYLEELYVPAASAARALDGDYDDARDLAAWKARVRKGWGAVRIDHVESSGVPDQPELGGEMDVRVFCSLGELVPEDVEGEVLHGRVRDEEILVAPQVDALRLEETYEGGRYRFEGHLRFDRTGPFGYSVRIVPRHRLLASATELGLAVTST
ncbi:MAG: glycosyltransferase family 1 protein [Marmoricola sp.]